MEDLGRRVFGRMMLAGEDMREPMSAAVAVLADMARQDWPVKVPLDGETYLVPPYDIEAQMIEADLLPSWFWPHMTGTDIPDAARAELETSVAELLPLTQPARPRLGAARLSLAEPPVAAGTRGVEARGAHRHAGLPPWPSRL
jgi:aminoglycoside/choline kinase family phosphotransferase